MPDHILCVAIDSNEVDRLPDLINPLLERFGVMLVRDSDPPSDSIGTINLMAVTIEDFKNDRYIYTNITKKE